MKILVMISSLDEYADINCLLLNLDQEDIRKILHRRELLQMIRSKDEGICSVDTWGIPGVFYHLDFEESFEEETVDELDREGYVVMDDDFTIEGEGEETDLDRTIITMDGIYFQAQPMSDTAPAESWLVPHTALLEGC